MWRKKIRLLAEAVAKLRCVPPSFRMWPSHSRQKMDNSSSPRCPMDKTGSGPELSRSMDKVDPIVRYSVRNWRRNLSVFET
jgi:hypothetical protein